MANLAAVLDLAMLDQLGIDVASEFTDDDKLPLVSDPVRDLGSRYLVKYIRADQERYYSSLSGVTEFPGMHFLTPTPLTEGDVCGALHLPPVEAPTRALLLDPTKLKALRGPRRIAAGETVEYLCDSFSVDALVQPRWGIEL